MGDGDEGSPGLGLAGVLRRFASVSRSGLAGSLVFAGLLFGPLGGARDR
ncbi:MAG: hypothetical protein LC714_01325 [Actinobacteria bacterium]|nr:hypothetical protein [Actinomycetota bacterium]